MKDERIFCVDEHDVPWAEFKEPGAAGAPAPIRYKGLTYGRRDIPSVTYVEYAPGHADPVHSHDTGEFFVVTDGEIWLGDACNGPGSIVFIPRDTEYSVRAGAQGARYFRIVT